MSATTSIVVIDDHPLFRKGAADLIGMDASLRLVGEACDGAEGLKVVARERPDLVLLDLNMKGMDGMATLRAIQESDPGCRVIMLTVSDNEQDVVEALRAGADGYLLKDMEPEDILAQLHEAAQGHLVVSPSVAELIARAMRADAPPLGRDAAQLTAREMQILELLTGGLTNKLIARRLGITAATVKVHVKHLLKKLHLRSRVEAAVWAIKHGVVKNA
ncbi:MAG: two-component system response regulator NarL [Gammaproteobacteria bacterium]|nr:two-component system response regulator NarL [Gammaproteobacteria bacterium]MCP5135368.1 two-component system response regulator NarL [Gammaproteobacteria bacterium]